MAARWEAEARASYDTVASAYTEITRGAATTQTGILAVVDEFADRVHARGDRGGVPVVLDVGCGPGWWTRALHDRGLRAVGLDISEQMVREAHVAAPGPVYAVASALALPSADGSVDALMCWYVLHHVPDEDVPRVVAEFVRVLRPGGLLLIAGHEGQGRSVKREGYGGLPMNVEVIRRPLAWWSDLLVTLGADILDGRREDADSASPWFALTASVRGSAR